MGFEVEPASVRHQYDRWDDASPRLKTCAGNADEPHPLGESPQLVSAGGVDINSNSSDGVADPHLQKSDATLASAKASRAATAQREE